jgi:hypothetical protein
VSDEERTCDGCAECCRVFSIPGLKEAGYPCPRLTVHPVWERCSEYADRPEVCRDFKCEWLRGYGHDRDKPSMTGLVFCRGWDKNESQLQVFACDDDLKPTNPVIGRMMRHPQEGVIWYPYRRQHP